MASNIKLKEVPPCLIIQMPRFGKSYKMYQHVLPSSLLDITDVLENCTLCRRFRSFVHSPLLFFFLLHQRRASASFADVWPTWNASSASASAARVSKASPSVPPASTK